MRDYRAWHRQYDDPTSALSWRLRKVQGHLRAELDRTAGSLRVVSACSGDGRDVLGVLSARVDADRVHATLVELRPDIADDARAAASALPNVEVRTADAGESDSYFGAVPAGIVLMVGVFGNIGDSDVERTVRATPQLCAPGALVVWSRAPERGNLNDLVRRWYAEAGCTELDYAVSGGPVGEKSAIGAMRFTGAPQALPPGRTHIRALTGGGCRMSAVCIPTSGTRAAGWQTEAVSLAVRVIACLDVDGGRVVKGVNFTGLRDAGDPVELARRYDEQGADELTFLDISASPSGRQTTYDVVRRTAEQVFIPLTVGGGVRTAADVDALLRAGADKVGVNTAAIARPQLIAEIAQRFGNQVLVLSADARRVPAGGIPTPSGFEVTTHGGRQGTGIDAIDWLRRAAELGAGEILLNSMDADGFDLELIRLARAAVHVPVIASGGAGLAEHFAPAVEAGADAVLAASVFHFGELTVGAVKDSLRTAGVPVR